MADDKKNLENIVFENEIAKDSASLDNFDKAISKVLDIEKEEEGELEPDKFSIEKAPKTGNFNTTTAQTTPLNNQVISTFSEKSEQLVRIEKILAKDLELIYKDLPESRRLEFKHEGELTARKIDKILNATKVNVSKILKLIVRWLKMIPGVNKFFLEQSAKIKVDDLLRVKRDR